ncbi:hypothetical protein APHAL10511_003518 [Amanita phalloides]|nr:hypothetical protein APHAL10511_003518 [Amanita phalloides]
MINKHESFNQVDATRRTTEPNADSDFVRSQNGGVPVDLVSRCMIASSPQEYLPDEVLRLIFVLIVEEYGPVEFPFPIHVVPPQVVLSHVCSRWRMLAIRSFELWNNIRLETVDHSFNYYSGQPLQEWRLRAGNSTVFLSLGSAMSWSATDNKVADITQKTISPFKAKMLHLNLTIGELMALSKLQDSALSDTRDLGLTLTLSNYDENFSIAHRIFTRLQSVTFWKTALPPPDSGTEVVLVERFPLPWSQLRCLTFAFPITDSIPIIAVLRQTPMLQSLNFIFTLYKKHPLGHLGELIMPCLRTMVLEVGARDLDKVLCNFTCPVLVNFTLTSPGSWTDETFEIIKRQYNMRGLLEIKFGGCHLPISVILKGAPLLRALYVNSSGDTTMDDDAITGISNGTLGRHLRRLLIKAYGIEDKIIEMVETRKRMADGLIENGCNWREAITVLTEVKVRWHGETWKALLL